MKAYVGAGIMVAALLSACSRTVMVPVAPRMDLKGYGTVGIVDFNSNSERAISARATRQFQEQVQAAQPGTRFIELGERPQLLAAVGARQLDAVSLRKIGEKYGVAAVFVGDLAYSEPRVDVKVSDMAKLEGGVRAEIRGDISARLLETASGASVWSTSGWARRQVGALKLSADYGVSGAMSQANPREEMVPTLVHEITHDFRPTYVRQPAH
ncbi:MAG: hypothetical protein E6H77_01810 [Betaproteobacteria bacterium]|nr:MAG: hypothetical protein E6H77_01810 [Betaproteobacteria bacterium]